MNDFFEKLEHVLYIYIYCVVHTCAKKLYIVYLKFNFYWASCTLSGNSTFAFPLVSISNKIGQKKNQ